MKRSLKGLHQLWSPPPRRRPEVVALRLAGVAALVFLLLFTALACFIARYPTPPFTGAHAQAAIVLGAAVWADRPSPVFMERIRHAIELFHAGRVQYLVFTGGVGTGKSIAEAEAARAMALDRGVPAGRILTETRSRTTFENLQNARGLLGDRGIGRVLIVSDPLHLRRAMTMARDLGLEAEPAATPTTRYRSLRARAGLLLHETWYYGQYLVTRRISDCLPGRSATVHKV